MPPRPPPPPPAGNLPRSTLSTGTALETDPRPGSPSKTWRCADSDPVREFVEPVVGHRADERPAWLQEPPDAIKESAWIREVARRLE